AVAGGSSTNYEQLTVNPNDVYYWRLNIILTTDARMNRNADAGFEEFYNRMEDIELNGKNIKENSVSLDSTEFIKKSSNLYNEATALLNKIVGTNGTINDSASYRTSQPIPVKPSETYFTK